LSDDYHDYVIKEGKLVGRFEEMYQLCENPWPETEDDLDANPVSLRTAQLVNAEGRRNIFSLGCGKGLHLNWLAKRCPGVTVSGCDVSATAVQYCRERHPWIAARQMDVREFCDQRFEFDLLLLREIVWYILSDWDYLCRALAEKYRGRHVAVELSFYDRQSYGKGYFNGPSMFINKFPFKIKEILRHHCTRRQREGMLLVYGQI
jgi:SAM-dependent methyltransferase